MSHALHFSTRMILPNDLPTVHDLESGIERQATDQELLNMNIARTPDPDHYSCAEMFFRDDRLFIETGEVRWDPAHGVLVPGTLVTQGPNRYRDLPPDIKPKIMLARVIRSTVDGETPRQVAQANLDEQTAAIAEHVGLVDGGPLVDLATDSADVDEAKRLVALPDSGLEMATMAMILVDPALHIVDADNLDPHRWAGERVR